ncbi:hypothetical protein EDD15DRAFT_2269324 [Pisolithus albus]|nr:hypothetical protein EDD15DRAFT_2269324 [Pisolithus albus]
MAICIGVCCISKALVVHAQLSNSAYMSYARRCEGRQTTSTSMPVRSSRSLYSTDVRWKVIQLFFVHIPSHAVVAVS